MNDTAGLLDRPTEMPEAGRFRAESADSSHANDFTPAGDHAPGDHLHPDHVCTVDGQESPQSDGARAGDVPEAPEPSDQAVASPGAAGALTERKRPGAPKGNSNRWRHGLRSNLRTCTLPEHLRDVGNDASTWRVALEDAVLAVHGSVNVARRSLIRTAVDSEIVRRLLWRRYLAESGKITVSDETSLTGKVLAAGAARDQAIGKLGLDRDEGDALIRRLYGSDRSA